MSEFSFLKVLWEKDRRSAGAMDGCYKLYTWVNHTVLMLLLQIFWKVSQISDYFKRKSVEPKQDMMLTFTPLTKESKYRRHIRSMSDVHCTTPYRIPFRLRKGSSHNLMYDSDTRAKWIRSVNKHRWADSSDSSDYFESPKSRSLEQNIMKRTDSMRVL